MCPRPSVNDKKGLNMENSKPALKRLLSVEETGAYLGISTRTIYNMIGPRAKKPFPVKAKRVGKLVKFDIRDLEEYVESL